MKQLCVVVYHNICSCTQEENEKQLRMQCRAEDFYVGKSTPNRLHVKC